MPQQHRLGTTAGSSESSDARQASVISAVSGQCRAMPDGIAGILGNGGNVVSVSYRL
jgi:hypothetical protein